eukprot:2071790-Rhodomonas_salina.1
MARPGAFATVIECVPDEVGMIVTEEINIPTIGIGAGGYTSGQVVPARYLPTPRALQRPVLMSSRLVHGWYRCSVLFYTVGTGAAYMVGHGWY